ncbi:hypothetical protein L1887_29823 [Cichorium endivia]|nr:hypothetical protein L1887_29823 [Cichorium endivia]
MLVDSDDEDSFNMFATDFENECEEDDALDKKNELDRSSSLTLDMGSLMEDIEAYKCVDPDSVYEVVDLE